MGNNQYCQLEECREIEWNENRSNLEWIDSLKLRQLDLKTSICRSAPVFFMILHWEKHTLSLNPFFVNMSNTLSNNRSVAMPRTLLLINNADHWSEAIAASCHDGHLGPNCFFFLIKNHCRCVCCTFASSVSSLISSLSAARWANKPGHILLGTTVPYSCAFASTSLGMLVSTALKSSYEQQ